MWLGNESVPALFQTKHKEQEHENRNPKNYMYLRELNTGYLYRISVLIG
jgi:hypothetical protein